MSLQADALRLTALDRRLVRAVIEGNAKELANLLSDYLTLRDSLKIRLLDESVAVVEDADAAEVLRKIFTGDGLPSDTVIERLSSRMGDPFEINQFDEAEIEQLGSDLFYSWFSHHEYVTGLAELRPLILRASVSEPVSQLVRQAKDCYAFQPGHAMLPPGHRI